MKFSLNFITRLAGAVALLITGANIGLTLSGPNPNEQQLLATQLLMLTGAALGLILTPRLTVEPLHHLLRALHGVPLADILFVTLGSVLGLLLALLLTVPLLLLPAPFSNAMPLLLALLFGYIGAMTFASHRQSLEQLQAMLRRLPFRESKGETLSTTGRSYLLDTSAIIDGRIAEVSKTGFLEGTLLVPQFVLLELQSLADSSDELRRSKGRRGLELLNQMQKKPAMPIEIMETDVDDGNRVDDSLVLLARQYKYPIITNDFNLNRVAGLQGVRVLSLNQLSEAVRPPVSQDQRLHVLIRNEGNARQQGVGYLDDGTPVVVEDARHLIGERVPVIVTRVLQTNTGRLVFAQLDSETLDNERKDDQSETGKALSKAV
ncbi:MAG: TRAM domain-containing protein [Chloroflexaceae bacterium]|nr:TRAM domain-containing protein [Chloroflexaceae bacterium]NJL33235.1 TRAM domain-containing protein [Chloroflexaceae bacterium]NJO04394.1 TRAM domain-containing protein [Chloroflexaceae bacterium]